VRKLDLKALREPPVDSIPEPAASSSQLELKSSQLKKEEITKQEYGTAWPFTVDAVELACAKAGTVAVFFTAGGITYPLNLWARGSKIDGKVVTSDTRDLTNEHSLVPIFARGFAMCETGSAR
jgi:hypothetical protein